jgi:hypothetical protein
MTITEFRDTHQKDMKPELLAAGLYLEANGLLFGHDFVTGDALDLAAAFMTRKFDDNQFEQRVESLAAKTGKIPYEQYD